jgi:putative Mg2+ transporter-C (MgtC) family protein
MNYSQLSVGDIVVRLGLALISGLIIGYERESHGRAAGFRTTILTCVSSALAMIISEMIFVDSMGGSTSWRPDPARLAAGILTGMGFLGGAGIIRHENVVRGVTTAAVLWFVTILGLAFGSGHLELGMIGLALSLVTLFILPQLESKIRNDWYAVLTIKLKMNSMSEEALFSEIEKIGSKVKNTQLEFDLEQQIKTISCELKLKKQDYSELSQKITHHVVKLPGILHVKWT